MKRSVIHIYGLAASLSRQTFGRIDQRPGSEGCEARWITMKNADSKAGVRFRNAISRPGISASTS
ncbi:hypothetical protein [Nevskia ramosa]|uniref:hypothetical protein n=1 Tax=Nevskia ramosa TaxID=64002 RepID=UPI0012EB9D36|nr:hypothetical protein [Nevskia ramosa]